jgi:hypothetical protein
MHKLATRLLCEHLQINNHQSNQMLELGEHDAISSQVLASKAVANQYIESRVYSEQMELTENIFATRRCIEYESHRKPTNRPYNQAS